MPSLTHVLHNMAWGNYFDPLCTWQLEGLHHGQVSRCRSLLCKSDCLTYWCKSQIVDTEALFSNGEMRQKIKKQRLLKHRHFISSVLVLEICSTRRSPPSEGLRPRCQNGKQTNGPQYDVNGSQRSQTPQFPHGMELLVYEIRADFWN